MQKLNWIILKNKDRGIDYGVGTFIKQLAQGLVQKKDIKVFIIEIGLPQSKSFAIRNEDEVTILEIQVDENTKGIDTKRKQEKLSCNITRVVSQYIPKAESTVIHMNFIFQYFIARELKKILNGRVIFTQHLFTFDKIAKDNFFDTELHTYELVDKIIAVTNHGKKHLIAKEIKEEKIEVIYNGIDPKHFIKNLVDVKRKYGLNGNEKLVFYSGRIDPIKGLDYLCGAFEMLLKKISDCRLVIAGDGNFESLIKKTRKFSANISYLGFIPFEDVVALYHEVNIGVIPSLEEHCSYVALEMLHCGLPVVVSNLGGLREIFVHGENALLVDTVIDRTNIYEIAPNIEELENYMFNLLIDATLRTKFTQSAEKRAKSMFTADIMINNYLQTVKNLN